MFSLEANVPLSDECWVFKVGGSLLDLPDLSDRLNAVIRQNTAKPLLVVGGGKSADCVREWEQVHHLESSTCHWLAIRAMEFNHRLLEGLLPDAVSISSSDEAEAVWKQSGIAVLDVFRWLKFKESLGQGLPHSWSVTSDSIAAFAGLEFSAAGLMLLKSVDVPEDVTERGPFIEPYVDGYFAQLAPSLPRIVWCNLRELGNVKRTASRQL